MKLSRASKRSESGPKVKIDPFTVDKFKRLPGGLNEVAIKIVRDFGLQFDYDKERDVLELSGADLDILKVAVSSLEFWIDGEVYPATGLSCQVGYPNKGMVIWRFHGDSAVKFNHLFMQEISELKKISTVNVKAVPNRKKPTHVEVYCSFTVFPQVRPHIERIDAEINKLYSTDFFIPKDDRAKAKQFIKSRQIDTTVLYVPEDESTKNKIRVWIHGRENADVARARRDWMSHVGMIAAHSSSNDPENIERLNRILKSRQTSVESRNTARTDRRNSSLSKKDKTQSFVINTKIREYDDPNYPRPDHMYYPAFKNDHGESKSNNTFEKPNGLAPWMVAATRVSDRLTKYAHPGEVSVNTKDHQSHSAKSRTSVSTKRSANPYVSGSKMTSQTMENNNNTNIVGNFHMIGGPRVTVQLDENKRPKKHLISHVRNDVQSNAAAENLALPNVRYHSDINGLDIYMYRYSVVKLKGMEALVNVVDGDLKSGGTLNTAFEEGMGPTLSEERSIYLTTHGPLAVTENYVTSSGKLPCQGVIHVVGPRWQDYEGREQDCITDLHTAVYNALKTAENHQYRKVGLSAISSEPYFGVPRDVCAEMYVTGIVNYCRRMGPLYPVLEVHLVDLSLDMLTAIKAAYERWEDSLTAKDVVLPKDFLTVARPMEEKLTGRPAHISQNMVTFKNQGHTPSGAQMWTFDVLGRLKVHVYTGSVVMLEDVDTIVCGLDSGLNGRLAREVWEKAGPQYQRSLENASFRRTLTEGEVLVCDAGDLAMRSVLHAVIAQPVRSASHKNLSRLDHVNTQILQTVSAWGMPSVAIPLLGTGRLRERFEIEQCALQLVDNIIEFVLSRGPNLKLKELHLVNVHTVMTQLILQALRTRAHTKVRLENFTEPSNGEAKQADSAEKMVNEGIEQRFDGDGALPVQPTIDEAYLEEVRDSFNELVANTSSERSKQKTRRSSVTWSDAGSSAGNRRKADEEPEGREWVPTGRLETRATIPQTTYSDRPDPYGLGLSIDRGGVNGEMGGEQNGDLGNSRRGHPNGYVDGPYTDRGINGRIRNSRQTLRTNRTDPGTKSLRRSTSRKSYQEIYDSKGNIVDLRPVSESDLPRFEDSTDGEWSDRWSETDVDAFMANGKNDSEARDRDNYTDRNNNTKSEIKSVVSELVEKLDRLTQPLNFPVSRGKLYDTEGLYATDKLYTTEKVYVTDRVMVKSPDKESKPDNDNKKGPEHPAEEKKDTKTATSKNQKSKNVKGKTTETTTTKKATKAGTAKSRNTAASVPTTVRTGASNAKKKELKKSASTEKSSNVAKKPKIQTTIRKTVQTTIRKSVQTTFRNSDTTKTAA